MNLAATKLQLHALLKPSFWPHGKPRFLTEVSQLQKFRVINPHFTWIKYIIIALNKINHNFSFRSVLTVKRLLWLRAVISHSKKLQIINLDSKLHSQTLKEEILWIAIIGIHKYLNLSIHIFREINSIWIDLATISSEMFKLAHFTNSQLSRICYLGIDTMPLDAAALLVRIYKIILFLAIYSKLKHSKIYFHSHYVKKKLMDNPNILLEMIKFMLLQWSIWTLISFCHCLFYSVSICAS